MPDVDFGHFDLKDVYFKAVLTEQKLLQCVSYLAITEMKSSNHEIYHQFSFTLEAMV